MRLRAIWLLLFTACVACRTGSPDYDLEPLQKLNADAAGFERSALVYSSAVSALPGGGAVVTWLRSVGRFAPLVYRRADGAGSFAAEAFLTPDDLRETISTVPTLLPGARPEQVYAIWQARRPASGRKFIVFRQSEDAAATWSEGQTINTQPTAFLPMMTGDRDGALYGVYTDERKKHLQVFFNRSLDHGRTWLPEDVRIDAMRGIRSGAISVAVASDGLGRVLAVWEERGSRGRSIQAAASQDRGTTWTPPVRIDDGKSRISPLSPSVVFASGRAIVTWTAASIGTRQIGQVWSDVSSDGGLTWGEDVLVHEAQKGSAPRVHLVSDGARARMAFHAGPSAATTIYYSDTDAAGAWHGKDGRLTAISPEKTKCFNPRLAVDEAGAVVVVYEEGARRIRASRSPDGGKTWGVPALVYEIPAAERGSTVHSPQVAVRDGPAYVLWEVWKEMTDPPKTLAESDKKRPADLYVRRVVFRR